MSLLTLLKGGATGGGGPVSTAGIRRLAFNAKVEGDLSVSFSRSVSTIQPDGTIVAAHKPRYGNRRLLCAAHDDWIQAQATTQGWIYLGSGYDHDGRTPLIVLIDQSTNQLKIFRSSDLGTPVLTRSVIATIGGVDIAKNTPLEAANTRYTPRVGVVCHGLVYLICERYTNTNGAEGVSVFAMQATSPTATDWFSAGQIVKVGDVQPLGDSATYYGGGRGAEWQLSSYWPSQPEGEVLEAWFPFADYYNQPALGGQIILGKANRGAVGGQWTPSPLRLIMDSIQADGPVSPQHSHSAAVVFKSATRMDVIGFWGDTKTANRVTRHILTDATDVRANFLTAAQVNHTVHGSYGTLGNQIAGVVPAREWGSIIGAGDECGEWLYHCTPPDTSSPGDKFEFVPILGTPLFDKSTGSNQHVNSIWIQNFAPERGGPFLARLLQSTGGPATRELYRVGFSPDGRNWSMVANYPVGYATGTQVSGLPFLMSDKIGILHRSGSTGNGVYIRPYPTVKNVRPILVAPGGVQKARKNVGTGNMNVGSIGSGNTVTPCAKDAQGRWLNPLTGQPLDPQPPCLGPVSLFETGSTSIASGIVVPGENTGATFGANARAGCRLWIMPYGDGVGTRYRLFDGTNQAATRLALLYGTRRWTPLVVYDVLGGGSAWRPRIITESDATTLVSKFFVALDTLVENRYPGYPLPVPDVGAGDAAYPDELLTVTGLGISGPSWTVGVVCATPEEGWDTTVRSFQSIFPLFTIYGDGNNHIYVYANIANTRFEAALTSGGGLVGPLTFGSTWVYRRNPMRIVVARRDTTLEVSGTVGCGPVFSATLTWIGSWNPSEIRFASPALTAVSHLELYNVWVDESVGYDEIQRRNHLYGYDIQRGVNRFSTVQV